MSTELKQLFNDYHALHATIHAKAVKLIESCTTHDQLSKLYTLFCELNADENNQVRELPGEIYVLFLFKKSQLKDKANDINK